LSKNNHNAIQDLLQLAEQFGSPLYVYDAEKIQSQYNRLTKHFLSRKVTYQLCDESIVKRSHITITQRNGSRIGYCIYSSTIGTSCRIRSRKIFYTQVSLEEIEEVHAMGVQINIDNLSILEQFGAKHPHVPVCIRINPH
jgi:diaminopimelate decarboxylase